MSLDAPAATFGELELGEHGEEPCRRPAFLVGTVGELLPEARDGWQAQLMQQQRQAGGIDLERAHDRSHSRGALSKAS